LTLYAVSGKLPWIGPGYTTINQMGAHMDGS